MTTSRKKAAPTSGAKTTTEKRASKARIEQGLTLRFGFPEKVFQVSPEPKQEREVITEFQYPAGVTDAEKVAMAEARMQRLVADYQTETEQRHQLCRHLRDELNVSQERLDAALVMIRAFGILPAKGGDFDDGIPF
ncbi:MAG: hypothetical protein Q8J78_08910 [Moraxellaceae bacterium]|nr:hypothetical protein [Moraxellaceae bacterium]